MHADALERPRVRNHWIYSLNPFPGTVSRLMKDKKGNEPHYWTTECVVIE